jgi:hypothetical protein
MEGRYGYTQQGPLIVKSFCLKLAEIFSEIKKSRETYSGTCLRSEIDSWGRKKTGRKVTTR